MKITTKRLRVLYNRLYESLRNYIWSFDTATKIADLETTIYTTFPDLDNMKSIFNSLKRDVDDAKISDDPDLVKNMKALEDAINNLDEVYAKLYQVKEDVR